MMEHRSGKKKIGSLLAGVMVIVGLGLPTESAAQCETKVSFYQVIGLVNCNGFDVCTTCGCRVYYYADCTYEIRCSCGQVA